MGLFPLGGVLSPLGVGAGKAAPPSSLLTGIRSYWKMDEASGNLLDSIVATAFDLTRINGAGSAAGKIGNALALVHASDQYVIRDNLLLSGSSWSLGMWLYPTAASAANLFGQGQNAAEGDVRTIRFYCDGSGGTPGKIVFSGDNFAHSGISLSSLAVNTWSHICLTWDGTNIRFYFNGAKEVTAAIPVTYNSGNRFGIGNNYGPGTSSLDGRIDGVGAWSRALSDAEMANWYNGLGVGAGADWPFTGIP